MVRNSREPPPLSIGWAGQIFWIHGQLGDLHAKHDALMEGQSQTLGQVQWNRRLLVALMMIIGGSFGTFNAKSMGAFFGAMLKGAL